MTRDLIFGDMAAWLGGAPVPPRNDILGRWGEAFLNYREAWDRKRHERMIDAQATLELYALRTDWIRQFGFAIPSGELMDLLCAHAPIVEIGAGTGYMTRLMRAAGIVVIGTDPGVNADGYPFAVAAYDPDQQRLAGKTAVRHWRDWTVFCSWPTLNHTWFRQALQAMRIGQRLIMVTEDAVAEETALAYLEACFVEETTVPIPCWPGLHDSVVLYRKRRQQLDGVIHRGYMPTGTCVTRA